jgi:hypothetical protein
MGAWSTSARKIIDFWLPEDRMTSQALLKAVVFAAVSVFASEAAADVITDWNTAALNAIRADRTAPPRASRALAMLHVAMFDAVNGIERTHEPYLVPSSVPASASIEAAASAAAHGVLSTLYPAHAAAFDQLYAATLGRIAEAPQKSRGITWGQTVATQILISRLNDNSDALVLPPPGSGPGVWVGTPPGFAAYLLPQWGSVAPFAMPTSAHFRPSGPPSLDSPAYATAYNEVKDLGGLVSAQRTLEQEQIALFWADGAGTETPAGHWNSIAQDVAAARGNTLPQNARLFALMNIAMADAAICAWDAKYRFNFWRPVTAIVNGDLDGNEATTPDPSWRSFLVTPPFPDYVSGHSTFSGAAARVLALFYGTDRLAFTTGSDFLPGVTRSFASFSEAAAEAAMSRIYGGIHYRFASDDGMAAGVSIGDWVAANALQANSNRSRK